MSSEEAGHGGLFGPAVPPPPSSRGETPAQQLRGAASQGGEGGKAPSAARQAATAGRGRDGSAPAAAPAPREEAQPPSFAPASRSERARRDREARSGRRGAHGLVHSSSSRGSDPEPAPRPAPAPEHAPSSAGRRPPLSASAPKDDPAPQIPPTTPSGLKRFLPSSPRAALSVLVVTLASGLLFAISASAASSAMHSDSDLIGLVRSSQDEVAALDEQVSGLKAQLDGYSTPSEPQAPTVPALADQQVRGPGVTITLTDAPPESLAKGATPNDLVIHQQDIEDVMNALWNGGAEAMTVQDVRVTGRTVIRCVGNVILVDGESFSPPYVIKAIGDPAQLRRRVDENPRIVNYKNYVALYGLGWEMTSEDELVLPAANTKSTNSYAQVVD